MAVTAQMVKELRTLTGAGMMDCKKSLIETDGNIEEAVKILREKGLAKAAKKAGRIAAEGMTAFEISEDGKKGIVLEVNSETDFVAKNDDFKNFVADVATMLSKGDFETIEELKSADFKGCGESVSSVLNTLIAKIGENLSVRRFDTLSANNGSVFGYLHGDGKIAVIVGIETSATMESLAGLGKDIAMQIAAMNPKFVSEDDVDQSYLDREKEILMQQALNEGKPQAIVEKMVEGRLKKEIKQICLLEQSFVKDGDYTVGKLVEKFANELGVKVNVTGFKRYEVGEGIEKKEENFANEVAATIANK